MNSRSLPPQPRAGGFPIPPHPRCPRGEHWSPLRLLLLLPPGPGMDGLAGGGGGGGGGRASAEERGWAGRVRGARCGREDPEAVERLRWAAGGREGGRSGPCLPAETGRLGEGEAVTGSWGPHF
jgi:hypothetical protein